MSFRNKLILVLSVGLVLVAADQATKAWARAHLLGPDEFAYSGQATGGKKPVISVLGDRPGVELHLSYNKGSAFGLFNQTAGSRVFLSIIGLGALGLIFFLLGRPESDSKLFVWALALVAGGAVGNLIDRILTGQVTDFVVMWVTPRLRLLWPWPAYNVADVALVVGVGLMAIGMFFPPPALAGKSAALQAEGDAPVAGKPKGRRPR